MKFTGIPPQILKLEWWTFKRRSLYFLVMTMLFSMLQYVLLGITREEATMAIGAVPILITGWLIGSWWAVAMGIVVTIISYSEMTSIMKVNDQGSLVIGLLLSTFFAITFGRIGDLRRKSDREIELRKNAEKELHEMTAQLILAEKFNAMGELTAGIAHELNQPLNGIKIICQSLIRDARRGTYDITHCTQDLDEVVGLVDRMAGMLEHMRIFTRGARSAQPRPVNLPQLVNNATIFFSQQFKNHHIKLVLECDDDTPLVMGEPIMLEQIILNLVSNARLALDKRHQMQPCVVIRTRSQNNGADAVLEVEDNGVGIADEIKDKIFQPFFTTREPGMGTGLGLSVAKKIIEDHNGTIEMKSSQGNGALFRIILPATRTARETHHD